MTTIKDLLKPVPKGISRKELEEWTVMLQEVVQAALDGTEDIAERSNSIEVDDAIKEARQ